MCIWVCIGVSICRKCVYVCECMCVCQCLSCVCLCVYATMDLLYSNILVSGKDNKSATAQYQFKDFPRTPAQSPFLPSPLSHTLPAHLFLPLKSLKVQLITFFSVLLYQQSTPSQGRFFLDHHIISSHTFVQIFVISKFRIQRIFILENDNLECHFSKSTQKPDTVTVGSVVLSLPSNILSSLSLCVFTEINFRQYLNHTCAHMKSKNHCGNMNDFFIEQC